MFGGRQSSCIHLSPTFHKVETRGFNLRSSVHPNVPPTPQFVTLGVWRSPDMRRISTETLKPKPRRKNLS
jgi:hypothetical protein